MIAIVFAKTVVGMVVLVIMVKVVLKQVSSIDTGVYEMIDAVCGRKIISTMPTIVASVCPRGAATVELMIVDGVRVILITVIVHVVM